MKKIICLIMVISLMAAIFAGCASEKTKVSVFFKNIQTNELSEERHSVDADKDADVVSLAKLAVSQLIAGPKNEKNAPVIDKEAKLLSLAVNDGVATVNMSGHYSEKKDGDALILRFAFINTLCSINGIDGIVIQVEGKPIVSETTGKEFGVLSISDIALSAEDNIQIELYFPEKDGEKLVLENRTVDAQQALSLEKTVVSELIKGTSDTELSGAIPEGTKLLNIETKDGICYVNFSSEFKTKTSSGSSATTLALYAVVNSLCKLENVECVQILIDGETGVEFGNYVLDIPYEANDSFVK